MRKGFLFLLIGLIDPDAQNNSRSVELAVKLMKESRNAAARGDKEKVVLLETDAALLAEAAAYGDIDINPFNKKNNLMLYQQWQKGRQGKEKLDQAKDAKHDDSYTDFKMPKEEKATEPTRMRANSKSGDEKPIENLKALSRSRIIALSRELEYSPE